MQPGEGQVDQVFDFHEIHVDPELAGNEKMFPITAELHRGRRRIILDHEEQLSGIGIPQANCAVKAGAGDHRLISVIGGVPHAPGMTLVAADQSPRLEVPYLDERVDASGEDPEPSAPNSILVGSPRARSSL